MEGVVLTLWLILIRQLQQQGVVKSDTIAAQIDEEKERLQQVAPREAAFLGDIANILRSGNNNSPTPNNKSDVLKLFELIEGGLSKKKKD